MRSYFPDFALLAYFILKLSFYMAIILILFVVFVFAGSRIL